METILNVIKDVKQELGQFFYPVVIVASLVLLWLLSGVLHLVLVLGVLGFVVGLVFYFIDSDFKLWVDIKWSEWTKKD